MSCDMNCEEETSSRPDGAGSVAMALRALESPDWPQLTLAVLGRNGTRREVVQRLADLILGTERRVYGADGVEIKVGDTVYKLETGEEYKVERVFSGTTCPVVDCTTHVFEPDQLTHTRPDSWERLEGDALKGMYAYFGFLGKLCDDGDGCPANKPGDCSKFKALDIIRRAKKLAGVEADG